MLCENCLVKSAINTLSTYTASHLFINFFSCEREEKKQALLTNQNPEFTINLNVVVSSSARWFLDVPMAFVNLAAVMKPVLAVLLQNVLHEA